MFLKMEFSVTIYSHPDFFIGITSKEQLERELFHGWGLSREIRQSAKVQGDKVILHRLLAADLHHRTILSQQKLAAAELCVVVESNY